VLRDNSQIPVGTLGVLPFHRLTRLSKIATVW
jgi:hypothetical protein